jgi:hypothetical protein
VGTGEGDRLAAERPADRRTDESGVTYQAKRHDLLPQPHDLMMGLYRGLGAVASLGS